jgi:hypothetical protein
VCRDPLSIRSATTTTAAAATTAPLPHHPSQWIHPLPAHSLVQIRWRAMCILGVHGTVATRNCDTPHPTFHAHPLLMHMLKSPL